MRRLLPLFVALLVATAQADTTAPQALLTPGKRPLVALVETTQFPLGEEHGLVLYEDGVVLYSDATAGGYRMARLDGAALQTLLVDLQLPELTALAGSDNAYATVAFESWADPINVLYVANQGATRRFRLIANLRQGVPAAARRRSTNHPSGAPPVLLHALEVLTSFRVASAPSWQPQTFEALLAPCDEPCKGEVVPWPPGPHEPAGIPPWNWVTLDIGLYAPLTRVLRDKAGVAFSLGGHKVHVLWPRLPLPGESAWRHPE